MTITGTKNPHVVIIWFECLVMCAYSVRRGSLLWVRIRKVSSVGIYCCFPHEILWSSFHCTMANLPGTQLQTGNGCVNFYVYYTSKVGCFLTIFVKNTETWVKLLRILGKSLLKRCRTESNVSLLCSVPFDDWQRRQRLILIKIPFHLLVNGKRETEWGTAVVDKNIPETKYSDLIRAMGLLYFYFRLRRNDFKI